MPVQIRRFPLNFMIITSIAIFIAYIYTFFSNRKLKAEIKVLSENQNLTIQSYQDIEGKIESKIQKSMSGKNMAAVLSKLLDDVSKDVDMNVSDIFEQNQPE